MSRSVVLVGTPRCDRCRFPPRWCICAGWRAVDCPVQVDVLIHNREFHRPTSTGRLIQRVLPASRQHIFRSEEPLSRESVAVPGRTLCILHPRGEPLAAETPPENLQVLLLDGSWPEAVRMAQAVAGWGKLVRLPPAGPSRYRLREQMRPGHYATIESLLFLLTALGLTEAEAALRLQFELHVYAGLRARGQKATAEEYLATSPARTAFPELLARLAGAEMPG